MIFAGGDVYIHNDCHARDDNESNLGYSYVLPSGMTKNTTKAMEYLGGASEFRISGIEGYSIDWW